MALTELEKKELEILSSVESGRLTTAEGEELLKLEGIAWEVGDSNAIPEDLIVQDIHPDFADLADPSKMMKAAKVRFLYKNLNVNPEEGMKFLQKELPGYDFSEDANGNVVYQKKGEVAWYPLDPAGFDIQDVSDVATDVGAGAIETLASAAGGIGGALSPVPGGALLGAGAAGSLTSAGLEALRQQVAKGAGVAENTDPLGVAISGGIGALSPALFGTGATLKQIAKAGGLKGLSTEALESLGKKQRGGIERAYGEYVAPTVGKAFSKVAETASGIKAASLKWLAEDLAKPEGKSIVREAEKQGFVPPQIYEAISDQIHSAQKEMEKKASTQYGAALKRLDVRVDAAEAERPFLEFLEGLKKDAEVARKKAGPIDPEDPITLAEESNYKFAKKIYDENAQKGGELSGIEAVKKKDIWNELTNIVKDPENKNRKASPFDQKVQNKAREVASNIKKSILDKDTSKELADADIEWMAHKERQDIINNYLMDKNKVQSTADMFARGRETTKGQDVAQVAEALGVNISDPLNAAIGTRIFAEPSGFMEKMGGYQPMRRAAPAAAVGYGLGYLGGTQMGEGGHGTGVASGIAGATAAGALASPTALKAMIKASQWAPRTIKKASETGMAEALMNAGQKIPAAKKLLPSELPKALQGLDPALLQSLINTYSQSYSKGE